MKKIVKKFWLYILAGLLGLPILICVASYLFTALFPESTIDYASRVLKVDVPKDAIVIVEKFEGPSISHGDGYTWVVLQIPPERINEFRNSLAASTDWKPLPLSTYLAEHANCLQPDLANGKIPTTNVNGYYRFIDHQEEYNKTNNEHRYETEKPICHRSSDDFFFSLFDEKDGRLYIWYVRT